MPCQAARQCIGNVKEPEDFVEGASTTCYSVRNRRSRTETYLGTLLPEYLPTK